jgi:hypothetical protein
MEEQDGTQRTHLRVRGHRLDRTPHRLGPSSTCMKVYAGVQNSASAVMATAQNRLYAHNNGTRMVRSHESLDKERQGLGPRVHACMCVVV